MTSSVASDASDSTAKKGIKLKGHEIDVRITVKVADMETKRAIHAQNFCRDLILAGRGDQKLVAKELKREFDAQFGPTWQCIAGNEFGAEVTHREGHFLYMFVEDFAILLFKSV